MNLKDLKMGQTQILVAAKETLKEWKDKIKGIKEYCYLNLNGTAYDSKKGTNLDAMMSDFRTFFNKVFLERWGKAFGLDVEKFDEEDFDEDGNFVDRADMTLVYKITFSDKSALHIDFEADDSSYDPMSYDVADAGDMAEEFMEKSQKGELQWNTDDLDKLVK